MQALMLGKNSVSFHFLNHSWDGYTGSCVSWMLPSLTTVGVTLFSCFVSSGIFDSSGCTCCYWFELTFSTSTCFSVYAGYCYSLGCSSYFSHPSSSSSSSYFFSTGSSSIISTFCSSPLFPSMVLLSMITSSDLAVDASVVWYGDYCCSFLASS